jgi:Na+-transporting NADH:ubiquinone oxidoreductase subunit NqrF
MNSEQFWVGGWTCQNCGCEIDRKGNNLTEQKEKKIYKEEIIKEKARLQAQKEFKKK